MFEDPVYITLERSKAVELFDLCRRINVMHHRALSKFKIGPTVVDIQESFPIYKEEGVALAEFCSLLNSLV